MAMALTLQFWPSRFVPEAIHSLRSSDGRLEPGPSDRALNVPGGPLA